VVVRSAIFDALNGFKIELVQQAVFDLKKYVSK
jgi:hypothetical protein